MKKLLISLLAAAAAFLPSLSGFHASAQMEAVAGISSEVQSLTSTTKGKYRIGAVFGGIGLGMISTIDAPEGIGFKTARSWEVSWLYILGVKVERGINALSFGVGVDWKNYAVSGGWMFNKAGGQIGYIPAPEGAEEVRSRLKTFALQFPLMYTVKARHLKFNLGPVFNVITHSSTRTAFHLDNRRVQLEQNNIFARTFTVDAMALITYDSVGAFCRYSPMKVLKEGRGPEFSSLSFGLMIGF